MSKVLDPRDYEGTHDQNHKPASTVTPITPKSPSSSTPTSAPAQEGSYQQPTTPLYDDLGNYSSGYTKLSKELEALANETHEPGESGQGYSAAVGEYGWDKDASKRAGMQYESDVLAARQRALASRQDLDAKAKDSQKQFDMEQYASNQSIDKAGWTGGYVLDANRQLGILRESLKADMYTSEELQRYGYDTALAAARLAYDMNEFDLALDYYDKAVNQAMQLASITGHFVSPENTYHANQYNIAMQQVEEAKTSGVSDPKAEAIIKKIEDWYAPQYDDSGNLIREGISRQGVKSFAAWQAETSQKITAITSAAQLISFAQQAELATAQEKRAREQHEMVKVEHEMALRESARNALGDYQASTYVSNQKDASGQYIQYNWESLDWDSIQDVITEDSSSKAHFTNYIKNLSDFTRGSIQQIMSDAVINGKDLSSAKKVEEFVKEQMKNVSASALSRFMLEKGVTQAQLKAAGLDNHVVSLALAVKEGDENISYPVTFTLGELLSGKVSTSSGIDDNLGGKPPEDDDPLYGPPPPPKDKIPVNVATESSPHKWDQTATRYITPASSTSHGAIYDSVKSLWDSGYSTVSNDTTLGGPMVFTIGQYFDRSENSSLPTKIKSQSGVRSDTVHDYITAIERSVNDGTLPVGSAVQFNYGGLSFWGKDKADASAVYLGNGIFTLINTRVTDSKTPYSSAGGVRVYLDYWTPSGYILKEGRTVHKN